jgi:folate-dependent phosphoribosylglycinamide formyltransferase PurN
MYGMRVHRAVLEAGCYVTGVTVHHVDERYDEGRPLAQWPVPVLHGDTAETLAARVLRVEHLVYPLALEVLARRLAMGHAAAHGFAGEDNAGFAWTNDVVAIRQALWKGLCSGAEDA